MSMKIIKVYKNGMIMLPPEVMTKLKLHHKDRLVIVCKHNGFVACKVEDYQNWLTKIDMELLELDAYSRKIFAKRINLINAKEKEGREVL